MIKEEFFINCIIAGIVVAVPLALISLPVAAWNSAGITQKAINEQCGTSYSQWDMFMSGSELTELCRIKQQELLIKQ